MISVVKISEYLPVILIFLFAVYHKLFIEIANTSLGRFIAVLLIILYTSIDVIQGLFVCVIIILFYQMDFNDNYFYALINKENMTSINPHNNESPYNNITNIKNEIVTNKTPVGKSIYQFKHDQEDNIETIGIKQDSKYNTEGDWVLEPKENLQKSLLISSEVLSSINNGELTEPFTQNGTFTQKNASANYKPNPNIFHEQHCNNGKLMYKEFPVKKEMAQHMFPEIEFKNDNICNLCDPNCEFAVNKINAEQKIVRESFISLKN
jgi:hypothetical protein